MEVDAPDSGTAAIGGIAGSIPSSAASEEAPNPQTSASDVQLEELPVDVGVADVTPTPTGPAAEAIDKSEGSWFRERYLDFLDFIKSCTAPPLALTKWRFLDDEVPRLRIDMPPLEFVEALGQEFGADGLPVLGLYERVDGELRLPSWLDGDAPLYVTIDEQNLALSFHRPSALLFPMARTALDYALECNPRESTQALLTLFVVESQDAAEIMQRLGLRAVSGEGLQSLGRDDVQRIFAGDRRSELGWRYHLLLVDFDVVCLKNQPTATIGEVVKRLADAADVYNIEPARRFSVCRPSAHEFQVLERATTFEDSAQICQLFEMLSESAKRVRIDCWRTHFDTEVASFSVASAALTRALKQSNEMTRRAEVLVALPAYRVAARAAVIQKFYEHIDSASDPFEQVDLIAAAGYAETFLDCDPLVRMGEAVLANKTPPSARELHEELFEQRQKCLDELRRIQRDRKAKR